MSDKIPYSGFWFTDAKQLVDCPRCGQVAGSHCRTPAGRKTWPPHGERLANLNAKFPDAIKYATFGTPERAKLLGFE